MDQEKPLKYHEEKDEKRETMTYQVVITGEKIRESVEVYEEGNNEQLLRTVREFKTLWILTTCSPN